MTRRRGPTILAVALLVAAACGDRADEGGAPEAVADEERPPGSPAPEPADEPEDEPTSDAEPTAEEPPESSEEASEPEPEPSDEEPETEPEPEDEPIGDGDLDLLIWEHADGPVDMHLDDSGNATPIMALIVAALETELGIDLPDPTPAAAYAGGDPVMTEPGLVMERVAAFTLPTDEFEPFLTDTEIWEVVSPWDEAYARNVPEVVALVLELDMDPADCPATCGISVTGDQPGVPPIDPSPTLPVWIPGNGVVSEQTWFPDGQFVDVFLNGDGAGGFQRFANPANVVLHSNRDRHFYIGVVPYVATGVAAFNSETRDPLGAYHQYVPVGDIAPFPGESVEEVLAELLGGG